MGMRKKVNIVQCKLGNDNNYVFFIRLEGVGNENKNHRDKIREMHEMEKNYIRQRLYRPTHYN